MFTRQPKRPEFEVALAQNMAFWGGCFTVSFCLTLGQEERPRTKITPSYRWMPRRFASPCHWRQGPGSNRTCRELQSGPTQTFENRQVTLLLMNSIANEALPLFLDQIVPPCPQAPAKRNAFRPPGNGSQNLWGGSYENIRQNPFYFLSPLLAFLGSRIFAHPLADHVPGKKRNGTGSLRKQKWTLREKQSGMQPFLRCLSHDWCLGLAGDWFGLWLGQVWGLDWWFVDWWFEILAVSCRG